MPETPHPYLLRQNRSGMNLNICDSQIMVKYLLYNKERYTDMRKLMIALSAVLLITGCTKKKEEAEPAPVPTEKPAQVIVVTPPADQRTPEPEPTAVPEQNTPAPATAVPAAETPAATAEATPSPTPTSSADPVYTAGTYGWVEVLVDGLNVRSKAGTDGNVVGQTQNGSKLYTYAAPVTSGGYTWYKINREKEEWIADQSGKWLNYHSYPEAAASNTVEGTPVKTDGTVGYIKVNVDHLNIRSKAGTDGAVVGTAKNGGTYYVYGEPVSAEGYTWYKISASDETWVADSGSWLTYTKFN